MGLSGGGAFSTPAGSPAGNGEPYGVKRKTLALLLLLLGIVAVTCAWWLVRPFHEELPDPGLSRNLAVQVDGIALGTPAQDLELQGTARKDKPVAVRVTSDPQVLAFLDKDATTAQVRLGPAGVETVVGTTLSQAGKRMLSAGDTRKRCLDRVADLDARQTPSKDLVAPVRGGYVYLGFRQDRLVTILLAQEELRMLYQGGAPVPRPSPSAP